MRQLIKYFRQIFIDDISVLLALVGLLLTILCWTIGMFFWGIELLLLPIMLGILLLMIAGPAIIILYVRRKNQGGERKVKNLGRLKSFVLGTYLSFSLLNPVYNWDEVQRQKSGLIISENLEAYKVKEGRYPPDLLKIKNSLNDLPITYRLEKFSYNLKSDNDYDLDIPIPIMDRWHWDRKTRVFIYDDF